VSQIRPCPSCGAAEVSLFYEVKQVPVHSVLLLSTREEAVNYPKRDIALGFCQNCGFIFNTAFDPGVHEYSSRYEATQAYSPTFNAFARRQALDLIERYDLHNKDLIEIGCGQGEFLMLLCEMGGNRGVGFDPAYISERIESEAGNRISFIADFYSERYTHYHGDFVCCKMTLEHIYDTADFVNTVRRSIGDRCDTVVFFQIPNASYVLRDLAFWDIYYEHCSYFSKGSLSRLFRRCGFDVLGLSTEYDNQYLTIEARPGSGQDTPKLEGEDDLDELKQDLAYFSAHYRRKLDDWRHRLAEMQRKGQRAVIWGGGSKGVSFLTTLNIREQIEYAVDINPRKHHMYMAGTGQEIVGPEFLKTYRPEVVIVMNPVYINEIQASLDQMGVRAELIPV
jgi:hypothetical protein